MVYTVYGTGASRVEQRVVVWRHSRRIDFETVVDWHEEHRLLKAEFPVAVRSTRATYDIQFGYVERPTHANTAGIWPGLRWWATNGRICPTRNTASAC